MTHRDHLPQLGGDLFLTDGGIETTLIFHDGIDLPLFAAFDLLTDDEGTEALRRYIRPFVELARDANAAATAGWRGSAAPPRPTADRRPDPRRS